jgi:dolichyl-phosphate beta-glucosyltransferase
MAVAPLLSLIIPAYNEAGRIRRTVQLCQDYLERHSYTHEIIVAADGNDGSREIVAELAARDARVQVFGSLERRGKGLAVRQGVARARGQVIGFTDADYKTPIEELAKVLPWLERGYDVVIGSRAVSDSRIRVRQPIHRRLGSRAFGFVMHQLIGLHNIRDTQCGFKFFRRAVARDLFARQTIDGYMFDIEVLVLAEAAGYRIKEVGICWQDDHDSRLQLLVGNWQNLLDLFRIRFRRLHQPAEVQRSDSAEEGSRRTAA